MKRSLLFITLFAATAYSNAQTQVGNSDFELWETSTSELNEPINWNSFKTGSDTWASFAGQQMDRSTDVRPGSTGMYSAKIEANLVLGTIANGNITLGKINMGSTTPSDAKNYNYTLTTDVKFSEAFTDTPDSIYFWAKFTAGNTGHSARVSAVIHNASTSNSGSSPHNTRFKDPNDVTLANTVATAIYNFPYSGGNWEKIKVPFTYIGNPADAAYIIVTFTTNMTPGLGTDGDILLIDDMELIYDQSSSINEINTPSVHIFVNNNVIELASAAELDGKYSIYNASGSMVQSGEVAQKIDFNNEAGMYFIHLKTAQGTIVKKFIKN
jgi:hypothetical protein